MQVLLERVRLAFIRNMWTAGEYKAGDGKFRRSCTLIIEPGSDNEKAVKEAILSVANEKFGAKASGLLKKWANDSRHMCVVRDKSSQSGEVYEGFEGKLALTANRPERDGPILIVHRDGRTVLSESDGVIYGGCYVNARVHFYAQQGQFPGVRCTPLGVQYLEEGEAFKGGVGPVEAFSDLSDGADAGEIEEEEEEEETGDKKSNLDFI